jgi:hypothetical protein
MYASPAVYPLFSASLTRLQYTLIDSKNFVSNCLRRIILFIILWRLIDFMLHISGILYFLRCILACEGWNLRPEIQL